MFVFLVILYFCMLRNMCLFYSIVVLTGKKNLTGDWGLISTSILISQPFFKFPMIKFLCLFFPHRCEGYFNYVIYAMRNGKKLKQNCKKKGISQEKHLLISQISSPLFQENNALTQWDWLFIVNFAISFSSWDPNAYHFLCLLYFPKR